MFEKIRKQWKKDNSAWEQKVEEFKKEYQALVEKHGIYHRAVLISSPEGIVPALVPMALPDSDKAQPPSNIKIIKPNSDIVVP